MPGCRRECALSALVRVDRAASVAERAFDLLAPAALSTVATKTTEHMIEDIVTMSGSTTFWAGQLSIAVAVRAGGLRHDRCSFPCFALSTWERSTAIETHVTRTVGTSHDQGFRERLISSLPDSPPTENSTQTRTETAKTPGAFSGTDGSNPVFLHQRVCELLVSKRRKPICCCPNRSSRLPLGADSCDAPQIIQGVGVS